ncbi:colanic acid biosynthesis protein [Mycobacteroides abscessus subsp. abscessus]|nr:colanic acid biosynthesis protein [Mycobacteroides abscessus subsp. abscessus]
MKKILVDAYFQQNLGDDLFIKVLLDRYPNFEFHLLTAKKEYELTFRHYKNIKILKSSELKFGKWSYNLFYKLNESFLNFRQYDAYVLIGGSIFIQNSNWEEQLKERSYLPKKFNELGKKTFIIGANFGPYDNKLFHEKYKSFFTMFDDICFRDKYSYNVFKESNNVRMGPDVIFNLKIEEIEKLDNTIGISLIDLETRENLVKYSHNYNMKSKEIITGLVDAGYKIRLFSFCENEGDNKVINDILKNIDENYLENIKVINYKGNINEILKDLQECCTVIGSRFHSIILSLLFKSKTIPIIYSEKTTYQLNDLNFKGNNYTIRDIDQLNLNIIKGIIEDDSFIPSFEFLESPEVQFKALDLINLY